MTIKTIWTKIGYNQEYEVLISCDNKENKRLFFTDEDWEYCNMNENFEDVFEIPSILKLAYEEGKNGESFQLIERNYETQQEREIVEELETLGITIIRNEYDDYIVNSNGKLGLLVDNPFNATLDELEEILYDYKYKE
jgi:hypothetical protein